MKSVPGHDLWQFRKEPSVIQQYLCLETEDLPWKCKHVDTYASGVGHSLCSRETDGLFLVPCPWWDKAESWKLVPRELRLGDSSALQSLLTSVVWAFSLLLKRGLQCLPSGASEEILLSSLNFPIHCFVCFPFFFFFCIWLIFCYSEDYALKAECWGISGMLNCFRWTKFWGIEWLLLSINSPVCVPRNWGGSV